MWHKSFCVFFCSSSWGWLWSSSEFSIWLFKMRIVESNERNRFVKGNGRSDTAAPWHLERPKSLQLVVLRGKKIAIRSSVRLLWMMFVDRTIDWITISWRKVAKWLSQFGRKMICIFVHRQIEADIGLGAYINGVGFNITGFKPEWEVLGNKKPIYTLYAWW